MEVKSIGPVDVRRIKESPPLFDPEGALRPGFVVALVSVSAIDSIDDGEIRFDFKTRIPINDASAVALAELEQQAARHLAQELRAVADALDAWSPAD